ncbi:MAG: signal peptidase [Phycisphaerales bacterium]|nr:signal peptidase [Phycisphaerales bacterium]
MVALVAAAALLLANDTFVAESVVVASASMRPTLFPGDRAFLLKFPRRPIHRFAVIVATVGRPVARRVIKRVVALPGERVRVEDGWRVHVDGRPLSYGDPSDDGLRIEAGNHSIQSQALRTPAMNRPTPAGSMTEEVLLGPNEYFLLGDNRLASEDSRVFGPVTDTSIDGMVDLRWYSYDRQEHRLRPDRMAQRVR